VESLSQGVTLVDSDKGGMEKVGQIRSLSLGGWRRGV
jgi:hypothetical protein